MLGKYLVENYNGKKLGLLLENDEFGEDGKGAILEGIKGSDIEVVAGGDVRDHLSGTSPPRRSG